MKKERRQFTAVYRKTGAWYSGWIEEIPGVNTQGKTLAEVKENLREALFLILQTNRLLNQSEHAEGKTLREPVTVSL